MKGLILKDFMNLKKNARMCVMLTAFYLVFAIATKDTDTLSVVLVMFFAIFTLSLYSYDDLAKWDAYALTMPVTKVDMVKSKYIMMVLLTIIGAVLNSVLTILINTLNEAASIFNGFSVIGGGIAIVFLFYSILLPFITKLGVEKARLIFFVVYFIPFITIMIIKRMAGDREFVLPEKLIDIIEVIVRYSYVFIPLTVAILLAVSYSISVRIYCRKEF